MGFSATVADLKQSINISFEAQLACCWVSSRRQLCLTAQTFCKAAASHQLTSVVSPIGPLYLAQVSAQRLSHSCLSASSHHALLGLLRRPWGK